MKIEKTSSVFVPFKDHYRSSFEQKKKEEKKKNKNSPLNQPLDIEKKRFIGWA